MAKTTSPAYTPSSDGRAAAGNAANANSNPAPASSQMPDVPDFSGAATPMGKSAEPTEVLSKDSLPENIVWETGFGPEIKSVNSGETVKIKLLHGVPVKHDGEMYYVATSVDEKNLKGYLVKVSAVENTNEVQTVSVSDTIELYNWEAELAHLFENIEMIRRNALLSFWKAGALFETDKANPKTVAAMFDSAYPYRMP